MIFRIRKKKKTEPASGDNNEPGVTTSVDQSEAALTKTENPADTENTVVEERITEKEVTPELNTRKRKHKFKNPFRLYILDLYILKQFLGTFMLTLLLMLAVIAMFDVTEKLDAFLTAPLSETLFDYFLSFLPYLALQLSPLFVFISVIF